MDANTERLQERKFRKYSTGITASAWGCLMDTVVDMVKPMFNGEDNVLLVIPQATGLEDLDDPDIRLEDGVLCVPIEGMLVDVFEPAVSNVLELIQSQLQQLDGTCLALFLLEEFRTNNYLAKRIHQEFAHRVRLIAVPPCSFLAAMRGAVYMGLEIKAK